MPFDVVGASIVLVERIVALIVTRTFVLRCCVTVSVSSSVSVGRTEGVVLVCVLVKVGVAVRLLCERMMSAGIFVVVVRSL